MQELENIVKLTKCDLFQALNYLNSREALFYAFLNSSPDLAHYQETYKQQSDLIHGRLESQN